jgi:hypothetical protein
MPLRSILFESPWPIEIRCAMPDKWRFANEDIGQKPEEPEVQPMPVGPKTERKQAEKTVS